MDLAQSVSFQLLGNLLLQIVGEILVFCFLFVHQGAYLGAFTLVLMDYRGYFLAVKSDTIWHYFEQIYTL